MRADCGIEAWVDDARADATTGVAAVELIAVAIEAASSPNVGGGVVLEAVCDFVGTVSADTMGFDGGERAGAGAGDGKVDSSK